MSQGTVAAVVLFAFQFLIVVGYARAVWRMR
jgi:hypothetical protein